VVSLRRLGMLMIGNIGWAESVALELAIMLASSTGIGRF